MNKNSYLCPVVVMLAMTLLMTTKVAHSMHPGYVFAIAACITALCVKKLYRWLLREIYDWEKQRRLAA